MNVLVDLLAKCLTLVFMPVPNSVHHQMQRRMRAITQELPTGCKRSFETLEIGCQNVVATVIEIQLFLHCRCRFRKQCDRVNGIRIFQFLPQIALYPGQVVFQNPCFITGRKRFQFIRQIFGHRLCKYRCGRAIGRYQVQRVLIANG